MWAKFLLIPRSETIGAELSKMFLPKHSFKLMCNMLDAKTGAESNTFLSCKSSSDRFGGDLQTKTAATDYRAQKVIVVSRRDQVYTILRQAIISSQLSPGELIRKEQLASQLGVSRTPVTEAISRLAGEGLVEIYPQTGTFVARLVMEKIETAQFVRLALETAAVRHTAQRASPEIVALMNDNLEKQKAAAEAADFERFYALDEALHDLICDGTGLIGLREIAAKERSQIDRARRLLLHYETRMSETLAEHGSIIAAIAEGDGPQAAEAMAAHISKMSTMLLQLRDKRPELFGD